MKSIYGIKLQQALIWGILIGVIYLLRNLFPVIFLTFILSYIGNTILKLMAKRLPYRRMNLTLLYVVILLVIVAMSGAVIPRVVNEGKGLARDFLAQQARRDSTADTAVVAIKLQPDGTAVRGTVSDTEEESIVRREARQYLDKALAPFFDPAMLEEFKKSELHDVLLAKIDHAVENYIPNVITAVRSFINHLFVLAFHFVLAMIFSFIILWDLPNLIEAARSFSSGRTAELYTEIAPGIRTFGVMLGRAFEAQTGIAIVNGILTSIGFWLINLESIALLATIVFFCSYIPVLGVVLSTLPAAILAFKAGGVITVVLLVVIVLVVHAIEAYGLNPLIYGHHMRMHPIAVLVILLIGEHLFGVWGLLLGVPLSAFILKYVIKGEVAE